MEILSKEIRRLTSLYSSLKPHVERVKSEAALVAVRTCQEDWSKLHSFLECIIRRVTYSMNTKRKYEANIAALMTFLTEHDALLRDVKNSRLSYSGGDDAATILTDVQVRYHTFQFSVEFSK